MHARRVTMTDLARLLGVSQATISKALAEDPEIPPITRERVHKAADQLGYRRDPAVSALVRRRWQNRRAPESVVLTGIWCDPPEGLADGPANHFVQQFHRGLREEANRLGYLWDDCWERAFLTPAGLTRHLLNRGVSAVVVQGRQEFYRPLDFGEFYHVLNIGDSRAGDLNQIRFDWGAAVEMAMDRLQASCAPVPCWGLVVHPFLNDLECRELISSVLYAGYVGRHSQGYVPIHQFSSIKGASFEDFVENNRRGLVDWIEGRKIEVILSNDVMAYHLLRSLGVRFPDDLKYLSLRRSYAPEEAVISSVDHQPVRQGERSVQILHHLMQTHQRGCLSVPLIELIEPAWHEGTTLLSH